MRNYFLMHIIKYSAPVSTREGPSSQEKNDVLRNEAGAEATSSGFERGIYAFDRSARRYSVLILLKFLLLPGRETFFEKEILNNHSASGGSEFEIPFVDTIYDCL